MCCRIADIPVCLASRLLDEQILQEQQWRAELPGGLQQLTAQPGASVQAAEEQVGASQLLYEVLPLCLSAALPPTPFIPGLCT